MPKNKRICGFLDFLQVIWKLFGQYNTEETIQVFFLPNESFLFNSNSWNHELLRQMTCKWLRCFSDQHFPQEDWEILCAPPFPIGSCMEYLPKIYHKKSAKMYAWILWGRCLTLFDPSWPPMPCSLFHLHLRPSLQWNVLLNGVEHWNSCVLRLMQRSDEHVEYSMLCIILF